MKKPTLTTDEVKLKAVEFQTEIDSHRIAMCDSLDLLKALAGDRGADTVDAMRSNLISITRRSQSLVDMVGGLLEANNNLRHEIAELEKHREQAGMAFPTF